MSKPYFKRIKLKFSLFELFSFSISSSKAFLTNSAGYIANMLVIKIKTKPRINILLYFHKNLFRYLRCIIKLTSLNCESTKIISKFAVK